MKTLKMSGFLISIFFLIVSMSNTSSAKVMRWPLKKMVEQSKLIVIGTVLKIENTNIINDKYGNEYKAIVSIEEVIKGEKIIDTLDLYYYPKISTEPDFIVNEKNIFFIKTWGNKYRTVQGYAGKIVIENNKITHLYIMNEEKTQDIKFFIAKIKKFL